MILFGTLGRKIRSAKGASAPEPFHGFEEPMARYLHTHC